MNCKSLLDWPVVAPVISILPPPAPVLRCKSPSKLTSPSKVKSAFLVVTSALSANSISGAVKVKLFVAVLPLASTATVTLTLVVAAIATLPFSNSATIFAAEILKVPAPSPAKIVWSFNSALLVPVLSIVATSGSNNNCPFTPFVAEVSKPPSKPKLILPETSTKPPSPDSSPPVAEIKPLKEVVSSAQTMTLPPSPLLIASALICVF